MDNLLVELECPICTDYLTIPIRQCATGHSICEKCIKKLERCALCQADFTESRNLTLEGLALKMTYPCINKEAGCSDLLAYADRDKHELRCSFKGFQTKCAMKGCPFIGNEALLKSHWVAKKNSKIFQTTNSSYTKLKNDSFYVNLAEGFGELFWFKCKFFNNTMYFAMQFIGKSEGANQYYFEIEIIKPDQPKKKVILGDYCKSIDLSDNDLFKEDNCCTIGFGNVTQFLVNDGLKYFLKFYKDEGTSNSKFSRKDKSQFEQLKGFVSKDGKSQNQQAGKPEQFEQSKSFVNQDGKSQNQASGKSKPSNEGGKSKKGKSDQSSKQKDKKLQ